MQDDPIAAIGKCGLGFSGLQKLDHGGAVLHLQPTSRLPQNDIQEAKGSPQGPIQRRRGKHAVHRSVKLPRGMDVDRGRSTHRSVPRQSPTTSGQRPVSTPAGPQLVEDRPGQQRRSRPTGTPEAVERLLNEAGRGSCVVPCRPRPDRTSPMARLAAMMDRSCHRLQHTPASLLGREAVPLTCSCSAPSQLQPMTGSRGVTDAAARQAGSAVLFLSSCEPSRRHHLVRGSRLIGRLDDPLELEPFERGRLKFHNVDYRILTCSRKVRMSCFCKVGMSHSPAVKDAWEMQVGLIAMSERDLQRIEVLSKVFAGR